MCNWSAYLSADEGAPGRIFLHCIYLHYTQYINYVVSCLHTKGTYYCRRKLMLETFEKLSRFDVMTSGTFLALRTRTNSWNHFRPDPVSLTRLSGSDLRNEAKHIGRGTDLSHFHVKQLCGWCGQHVGNAGQKSAGTGPGVSMQIG